MASRRYQSNMDSKNKAPTGLRVNRIKSYEPTAGVAHELLVRAQAGQLGPTPDIGGESLLDKSQIKTLP